MERIAEPSAQFHLVRITIRMMHKLHHRGLDARDRRGIAVLHQFEAQWLKGDMKCRDRLC
ncbi:MAG: hypothetical protein IPL81_04195 [Flavobacteriales bacterium]|nr:hypothetical protein [Flavobacteriales bacterium]